MPVYEHRCLNCGYEWEDLYSLRTPIPDTCPNCKTVGQVKRLISGDISVRVALHGQELKNKINEDVKKMKHEIKTNEEVRANLSPGGESGYHQTQLGISEIKNNIKNI
jgi:putative FmdB family regulatory protein